MHWGIMIGILGRLSVFMGIAMFIPLLNALLCSENNAAEAFIYSILICFGFGFSVFKMSSGKKELSFREGFAIVTFGWLLAAVVGALPFVFSGVLPSFIDAFFEALSGFTTTGASVISDVEIIPESILLWRGLTHWLGGMGIIVLFIAVLPQLGIGAMALFKAEVPGPVKEKILPRIRDNAKILWYIYIGISGVLFLILLFMGMDFSDAINHTFATMATGGFSTKNISIGYYDSAAVNYVLSIFMIIAGGNFSLYYLLLTGWYKDFFKDSEFRAYIFIILASTFLIMVNIHGEHFGTWSESFNHALFQVASIITTTGFASTDFDKWPYFSKMVLLLLMFVGGCTSSTAGAMKVSRILLLIKHGVRELNRMIHPRAIVALRMGNKVVEMGTLINVMQFFFLYIIIFVAASLVMCSLGLNIEESLSSVAATLGNVGPGFGIIGPMSNYSSIPPLGKIVLSLCMLLGRLELYTVLVMLLPRFWRE